MRPTAGVSPVPTSIPTNDIPTPESAPHAETARAHGSDLALLVALAAMWGGSFLFMRVAAPEFGPVALIEVRVVIASLFLLPLLAARGGLRQLARGTGPMILIGAINSGLPFCLLAYATLHLTAGFTSILNATAPLFAALVAFVWLKQRLSPSRVAGLFIGFAGVVVLVWGRASFKDGGAGWAVAAGLLSGLSYGIAANYSRVRLTNINPVVSATGTQVAAALLLLVPALFLRPAAMPSAKAWGCVAALGVICTGVAYIIYFRLIARLGAARAVAVTFLVPGFALLWGGIFLREPATIQVVLGAAVVLLGMALATGLVRFPRLEKAEPSLPEVAPVEGIQ